MPPLAARDIQRPRAGKRIRGALYLHEDAVVLLGPARRNTLAKALAHAPEARWNVVRFDAGPSVALLDYDEFDSSAFPALRGSTRIDLQTGMIASRRFDGSDNPLILHRKELLVRRDDPRRTKWAALTAALQAQGLFVDPHQIGRRQPWTARLAQAGLDGEGRPR